jgi:hypothetical protein
LDDLFLLDFSFLLLPLEQLPQVVQLLHELLVDLLLDIFSLVDFILQVVCNFGEILVQKVVDIGVRVLLRLY